jgi:hypothetical protein
VLLLLLLVSLSFIHPTPTPIPGSQALLSLWYRSSLPLARPSDADIKTMSVSPTRRT